MTALGWNRDLSLGTHVLRAATAADAEGVAALMSEPDVEQWWHQNWDVSRWAECLQGLRGDPGSLPLVLTRGSDSLGADQPGSEVAGYVEVYRVAADVLGEHIQHDRTDLGMHIALGEMSRGQGLGRSVIRTLLVAAGDILAGCQRLVAEPDERNITSIRAFSAAGFEPCGTVRLPDKTAKLMEADPNSLTVLPEYDSIPPVPGSRELCCDLLPVSDSSTRHK